MSKTTLGTQVVCSRRCVPRWGTRFAVYLEWNVDFFSLFDGDP